jgi:hypothetical protein
MSYNNKTQNINICFDSTPTGGNGGGTGGGGGSGGNKLYGISLPEWLAILFRYL